MLSLSALALALVLLFGVGDGGLPPCERAASCRPLFNFVGFLSGSVAGVVVFGLFIASDNSRRAAGRYRDPWYKPRSTVPWITILAGGLGLLHWYGFALDVSRMF